MDKMDRMREQQDYESRRGQFFKWGGMFATIVAITTVVIVGLGLLWIFVL